MQQEKAATIMVVDDQQESLQLLEKILLQRGYTVVTCSSGSEALSQAKQQPPELILLDVSMPGMDGYEVCHQLKADVQLRHIPVIFVSAHAEVKEKIQAFESGGVDYVVKPLEPLEIAARVRTHLQLASVGELVDEIEQRTRLEQNLRESEERFRQMAENVSEVFWMFDLKEKRVVYVNPAYEKIWGRKVTMLYRRPQSWLEVIVEADRESAAETLARQAMGQKTDIEYRIMRPDGEIRWIRDRAFPVHDEQGVLYRVAGIAEDITERKLAEEARIRYAEEQRDTLIREVHHRIKNNLQGVMGLLRKRASEHVELAPFIDEAISQVASIAAVYGLQSRYADKALLSSELIKEVIRSALTSTGQDIDYAEHLPEKGCFHINSNDSVAIALIMNELIINASKYYDPDCNECRIAITLSGNSSSMNVVISNPGRLPDGFDFSGNQGLGVGLRLVRSLLPDHARLRYVEKNGLVEATLSMSEYGPVTGY